jgi:hypothetical protein
LPGRIPVRPGMNDMLNLRFRRLRQAAVFFMAC